MRKATIIGLALVAGLMLSCGAADAHGTGWRQSGMKAVALEFMYSTGEMMSYREAKVYSPEDDRFAAQTGRIDGKGRFAFVPDVPGTWRVVVRDEEGHQCTAELDITPEFLGGSEGALPVSEAGGSDIFVRALLGVSIIFNIALLVHRRRH